MTATTSTENRAEARRQVAEQMLRLGERIERAKPGPDRLALLRQQAALSDRLESLSSVRH